MVLGRDNGDILLFNILSRIACAQDNSELVPWQDLRGRGKAPYRATKLDMLSHYPHPRDLQPSITVVYFL